MMRSSAREEHMMEMRQHGASIQDSRALVSRWLAIKIGLEGIGGGGRGNLSTIPARGTTVPSSCSCHTVYILQHYPYGTIV